MTENALSRWTARLGMPARPFVISIWILISALLTLISLYLNGVSNGATVLWFPHAFALAGVLALPRNGHAEDIIAGMGAGVMFGFLFSASPPAVAAGYGLINMFVVGLAAYFYQKLLARGLPHDTETTFLNFVALVTLPAVAIGSVPGAAMILALEGGSVFSVYSTWVIGSGIGLIGITPLVLWAFTDPSRRAPLTIREIQWSFSALTLLLVILGAALALEEEIKGLLIAILLVSLFALRTGRVGTMAITALLVPMLALSGILEREAMLGRDLFGLGTALISFAAVFTCAILPANLIAAMIARLESAERTQRDIAAMKVQFLSTMSHEIKTPMNAIHGMFELFSRSDLNEKQRRWADAGLSASRNLQAQVSQILDMARLEENTIKLSPHPVHPRKLLENWIASTEGAVLAAQKDLTVSGKIEDNVPDLVLLDEARVQQILINLLSNAVKFSKDGEIAISIRVGRGALLIEVADTGPGIAPQDQGRVFERFWQADTGAARRRDGSGLGLAICRELAILMGGSLTLRSTIDIGSSFRLTLPLIAQVPQEGAL